MTILGLTAPAFYVDFSDRYLLEISPAYVKEGFSNLRVGMYMEVATTTGAVGPRWLYMSHQRDCSNLRTGPALLGIYFDQV